MSCSTSLRLAVLMLACIAGFSAAQSFTTCPTVATSVDYFAPSNCSAFTTCATLRCLCVGGTISSSTGVCGSISTSGKTCTTVQPCQAAFVQCIQTAAATVSCLSSFKVALMNIVAGSAYNGSAIDNACRADTCRFFNTSTATNCTISYANVCKYIAPTPSSNSTNTTTLAPGTALYTGTLGLTGTFPFFGNATALAIFNASLTSDEFAFFSVFFLNLKFTSSSASVLFQANAAANDPVFLAKITAAVTNPTWLAKTAAVFTALGGTGTFGVSGITAVTPTPAPAPGPASASNVVLMWSVVVALIVAIFA